jgi:hypothetical protein
MLCSASSCILRQPTHLVFSPSTYTSPSRGSSLAIELFTILQTIEAVSLILEAFNGKLVRGKTTTFQQSCVRVEYTTVTFRLFAGWANAFIRRDSRRLFAFAAPPRIHIEQAEKEAIEVLSMILEALDGI